MLYLLKCAPCSLLCTSACKKICGSSGTIIKHSLNIYTQRNNYRQLPNNETTYSTKYFNILYYFKKTKRMLMQIFIFRQICMPLSKYMLQSKSAAQRKLYYYQQQKDVYWQMFNNMYNKTTQTSLNSLHNQPYLPTLLPGTRLLYFYHFPFMLCQPSQCHYE